MKSTVVISNLSLWDLFLNKTVLGVNAAAEVFKDSASRRRSERFDLFVVYWRLYGFVDCFKGYFLGIHLFEFQYLFFFKILDGVGVFLLFLEHDAGELDFFLITDFKHFNVLFLFCIVIVRPDLVLKLNLNLKLRLTI